MNSATRSEFSVCADSETTCVAPDLAPSAVVDGPFIAGVDMNECHDFPATLNLTLNPNPKP